MEDQRRQREGRNTSLTPPGPDENSVPTTTLDTAVAPTFACKAHGKAGLPNLAYLFLERNDADKTKPTGRLHVIGNEGNFEGTTVPAGLWSDDWYDSAADGSVEADITPIGTGAEFRAKAGAASATDLKFLNQGVAALQAGSLGTIAATPAWIVVGCPDYSPDMRPFRVAVGHRLQPCDGERQASPGHQSTQAAQAHPEQDRHQHLQADRPSHPYPPPSLPVQTDLLQLARVDVA